MSEIRVTDIKGENGLDAVTLSKGASSVGIITATGFKVGTAISATDGAVSATRFHGSGADLTGIVAGLVGFKHIRNNSTTTLNTTSYTTIFSISYTPQDGANNKVYVFASGQFEQDDNNGSEAWMKISCSGQHTNDIIGSEQKVGIDQSQQSATSLCTFLRDTNISNNNAITYNFQARTSNSSSDWRPRISMALTVIEIASGIDQT